MAMLISSLHVKGLGFKATFPTYINPFQLSNFSPLHHSHTHTYTRTHTHAVTASCHSSCPSGAGCLGPNDRTLCGTCPQSTNTCSIGPAPTPSSCDPTPIPWWPPTQLPYSAVFGVFFTFIAIVLAVLVVMVIVGVKLYKRLKKSRKRSFDINVS